MTNNQYALGSSDLILAEILAIPLEEDRILRLIACLEKLGHPAQALQLLKDLCSARVNKRIKYRKVHEFIALIAKTCAWIFRHVEHKEVVAFLHDILTEESLVPGAQLVINSYLSVASIQVKLKIITVVSIFDGQISLMKPSEHPLAENALHHKIEQFNDLYNINEHIDWGIIFIDDGDDRRPDNQYKHERTSRIIYRELMENYAKELISGKFQVIEMENEVRNSISSFQGGAIIYGMHKAIQLGAGIICYTNIDLDSHVGLQGLLLNVLVDGTSQIAIGSNRVAGSYLSAPTAYYLYSLILNLFVRFRLPIGNILDTHNAFKGFDCRALQKIIPMSNDSAFDIDMDYFFSFPDMLLARAKILGMEIKEVSVAMHRTAPLQILPSIRNGFRYYISVWKQGKYLNTWVRNKQAPKRLLAVNEKQLLKGLSIIETKDVEVFDADALCKYLCYEKDFLHLKNKLQTLLEACATHDLTLKRLGVLRKALSISLKRDKDRLKIADFLRRYSIEKEMGSTVKSFVESFLTVLEIETTLRVTTILAVGRIEDAIRSEYLEEKIEQLDDLFSINPKIFWRLIIVDEGQEGVSIEGWQRLALENYHELLSSGQLEFMHVSSAKVRRSNWFKGGSILLGMTKAVRQGDDYVIYTDAKPAIDLGQEGILLKYTIAEACPVVIGSRYLKQSSIVRCAKRRFTSGVYNRVVRTFLPHLGNIRDTQCGFKCFSHRELSSLLCDDGSKPFGKIVDTDLSFDTELLSTAVLLNYRVKEIPVVSFWPYPESWRLKEAIHMLVGLSRQRRRLSALSYLTEGKSAAVYLTSDRSKIIKILTVENRRKDRKRYLAANSDDSTNPIIPLFEWTFRRLIRYPSWMALIKWIQQQPLLRRIVIKFFFAKRDNRFFNLETIEHASNALPNDVVAPFTVYESRWVVLQGLFGNKVVKATLVEQEPVLKSLEQELAAFVQRNKNNLGELLIDNALALQEKMWRFGFFNTDVNILNDTRIDEYGKMMFTDVGDLTQDYRTALLSLRKMQNSLFHAFSIESIRRFSPILANYYEQQFRKVFSETNLKEQWNAETSAKLKLTRNTDAAV